MRASGDLMGMQSQSALTSLFTARSNRPRARWLVGQSTLEYAIMISAIVLAVSVVARIVSERLKEHAQRIEQEHMVF